MIEFTPQRRNLIIGAGAALITSFALPGAAAAATTTETLHLVNNRTGEVYNRAFRKNGRFIQSALDEFNWFARDWRQRQAIEMDPMAMVIAAEMQRQYGGRKMILISGYRTRKTNAALPGTAKGSYHIKGMAMDLTMPGVSSSRLYRTARKLRAGGVGKYTRSGFVHIDSGPVRTWGS